MVKVTLNENLVPSRDPWVKGNPFSDLVHNLLLAKRLIRVAAFLFQLRQGSAVFSGYICERREGFFTFKVRHGGVEHRTMVMSSLGYGGELVAEVEDLSGAIGFDVLGSLAADPGGHLAGSF